VFYYGESEKGEEFALALQEKLKAINPDYAREAKEGNDYYILNKSICPGVIVECGFLSCPAEAAMLTSEKYQQKIASAIADAIEEAY
jgi:N-acetylmuramoyl-L-alanine amidase